MTSLFRRPKQPDPLPPPEPVAPPPSISEAAATVRDDTANPRRRRGRAATLLTGPRGAGTPQTATRTLLGE